MGDYYLPGDQQLSYAQIKQLWLAQGGNPALADTMAAIALAESGGHTGVVNDTPATGDYSVGLWQINYFGDLMLGRSHEYGTPAALADSATAQAHAAISLAGNGSGLSNWSTFSSGAYKAHLAPGATPVSATSSSTANASWVSDIPGLGWLGDIGKGVTAPAAALGSIAAVLLSAAKWIADPHNWVRIAEVGGGLVAVFLGLKLLAGAGAGPVSTIVNLPVQGVQATGRAAKHGLRAATDVAAVA